MKRVMTEVKGEIKTYRDLKVWQKAMALVSSTYKFTTSFPKNEMFGLTSQIKSSVISIPSNIAEGYGRNSTNDYIRFLKIAMGSLCEYQTQLEIANNLGFITGEEYKGIYSFTREIERMLSSLIRKLKSR